MKKEITSPRLEIFKKSLLKKEYILDQKFEKHFSDVKSANGQPLNDKKNGHLTLARWEKQIESIRNQQKSIERTKAAIEKEEKKIMNVNSVDIPKPIQTLLKSGVLIQWRKHPRFFFVDGVEKARIAWDAKTFTIGHRYVTDIPNQEQYSKFRDIFNSLKKQVNETKDK